MLVFFLSSRQKFKQKHHRHYWLNVLLYQGDLDLFKSLSNLKLFWEYTASAKDFTVLSKIELLEIGLLGIKFYLSYNECTTNNTCYKSSCLIIKNLSLSGTYIDKFCKLVLCHLKVIHMFLVCSLRAQNWHQDMEDFLIFLFFYQEFRDID